MTTAPSANMLITYSTKDAQWVKPLVERMPVNVFDWDDARLSTGGEWLPELRQAIANAVLIVCVVSPDYLQSDFLSREEIPYLIDRRVRSGGTLVVIAARPCEWRNYGWLRHAEMIPADGRALDQTTSSIEELVVTAANRLGALLADPTRPARGTTVNVNLSRLPATEVGLVGRQRELQRLDRALSGARPSIVCITGESGIGKTALVNNWLAYLAAEDYRGAARVFGWSFDTEHVTERTGSADAFCTAAADWLGYHNRLPESAWARGDLIGSQLVASPTLLVLDALDLVQSPQDGALNDITLLALLESLGRQLSSGGLCVITSSRKVPELEAISTQLELGPLVDSSAAALLRALEIDAMSPVNLEGMRADARGNPLALWLLVSADLVKVPITIRGNDARPAIDRVVADLAEASSSPQVELLRILAVLDSPATFDEVGLFQAAPPLPISAVGGLRDRRLLSPQHAERSAELETHSVIREHFAQSMQTEMVDAWRAAHSRVYDQLKSQFARNPVALSETVPLYAATRHARLAGRAGEGFEAMRWPGLDWIGASGSGADLWALQNFVDASTGEPLSDLKDESRGWIALQLGRALLGIGRLGSAEGYLAQALAIYTGTKDWSAAASSALNLFELYLARGDLDRALRVAEQSAELAQASGDLVRVFFATSAHADACQVVGRSDQARLLFNDVDNLPAPRVPGLAGYWYNEFLLDRADFDEVERRLAQDARIDRPVAIRDVFTNALNELTRGRLLVAAPASANRSVEAVGHLIHADELFRRASRLDYAHRTVIARAEAWRRAGNLENANNDLQQALGFFNRTGMRLFQVECHLESTRLSIARNEAAPARTSLAQGRELVHALGYNRRAGDIAELTSEIDRLKTPPSAEIDLADVDPLLLVFRLVLDRRAKPELLESLDPALLPPEARGVANVRSLHAQLTAKYPTGEPNALWVAWVQATRQDHLAALSDQLAHGLVQGNAR